MRDKTIRVQHIVIRSERSRGFDVYTVIAQLFSGSLGKASANDLGNVRVVGQSSFMVYPSKVEICYVRSQVIKLVGVTSYEGFIIIKSIVNDA